MLKCVWRHKRFQITKAILKKKNRAGRIRLHHFRLLQSCTYHNNMVPAQKQNYRSMEQDRKPWNKLKHLWSSNLQQRKQEHTIQKRQSIHYMVLGKLDSYMLKKKKRIRIFFNTIQKINSKWIKDLNIRSDTIKFLVEKYWQDVLWHKLQQYFFSPVS